VQTEKVSKEAAREEYAVVVESDGTVDIDATDALRQSRRKGRSSR
jgi:hypothetical protein